MPAVGSQPARPARRVVGARARRSLTEEEAATCATRLLPNLRREHAGAQHAHERPVGELQYKSICRFFGASNFPDHLISDESECASHLSFYFFICRILRLTFYIIYHYLLTASMAFETTQMRWPHSHSYGTLFRLTMAFAYSA